MVEVRRTEFFDDWLRGLSDARAKAKIAARIDRLAAGNPGDAKPVGSGVSELRVDYGPGYRVYFARHGRALIILLAGGDKRTQARDIRAAIAMAAELKE
jgi:putative addiction module killer protein